MEIWKFPLEFKKITEVMAPEIIIPLHVHIQGQTPCVWAMVDPAAALRKKQFQIIATGEPFDPSGKHYIGTLHANGFVWHVFSISNHY